MEFEEFDIEFLAQKMSENPQSPLFARLADLYIGKEQSVEAIKLTEEGIKFFPNYCAGYIVLGKAHLALKEFSQAIGAFEKALELVDTTSPYALTGSVIAQDRNAVELATNKLRNAAGNFYINDKPTGAVVGQQPFGGARASGTNDKAGSILNLYRWLSPRTIKETFTPPSDYRYPFLQEK